MDQDTYTLAEASEAVPCTPVHNGPPSVLPDPEDARRVFSRLGLSMLVLTIAMLVAQLALDALLMALVPAFAKSWWRTWILSLVPLYGVGLPCMLLVLRGLKPTAHNTDSIHPLTGMRVEKTRLSVSVWLILLLLGFGFMYAGNIVGNIIMSLLSALTGYSYANALTSIVNESPMWMTFIGTCICAPFGEELLFRKLLIDRSRRYGDTVSILISGFFFGLFHGNLFQFFYAFLLGIILAYIYTRTGKYLLCVAMHAVVNLMGGIVMPALVGMLPTDPEAILTMTATQSLITLFVSLWMYGTMIAGLVLLLVRFRRRQLSCGTTPLIRGTAFHTAIINPGMLANVIVMCLMMALSLIPQ